jgi:hypothetical protein
MALDRNRLLFVLLLYTVCFILLYPFYQYIFDEDGLGYLMVVKHLSNGDLDRGINGAWSPLHAWLVVPLYKAGINEFDAFRISNGIIGGLILVSFHGLLKKAPVPDLFRTISLLVGIPVVLAYAYYELGADILFCLLVLVYANIITGAAVFESGKKNLLCGLVGCLCYLSKTYGLPFFIVSFVIIQFTWYKQSSLPNKRRLLTRNMALAFAGLLLPAIPWVVMLYQKYQFITVGYSGRLNYYWTVYRTEMTTSELLIAPNNMVCVWEDPYYWPTRPVPFPSFAAYALAQARVILEGVMATLRCFLNMSFLAAAIVIISFFYILKKKLRQLVPLLVIVTILPAGYLVVHTEIRYLWAVTFLVLLLGSVLLAEASLLITGKNARLAAWCLFFGSFLIYPVNQLKDTAGKGAEVFHLAAELQAKGVSGKWVSSLANYSEAQRLAYLTNSIYYAITQTGFHYEALLAACREKKIDYYFFYYKYPFELEAFKQTVLYKNAKQEIITKNANLLLLKMN